LEAEKGYLPLTIILEGTVMSSAAGCLSRYTFDPLEPPACPQTHPGQTAATLRGINDRLDLLQRAAEIMATGALTDEQAKTLSRQIRESLPAAASEQAFWS